MNENEPIRDPAVIRAWFETDWAESYQPVPRIPSGREMWIDVHADHNQEDQP